MIKLCNRTPRHRNQNSALHRLNQRHSLVHRVSPTLDTPALLSSDLSLLQIGKLPEMMHRIQLTNLYKPRTDALHDLSTGLEPTPPMRLPFEQVARVQSVGAEFEEAAQRARGRGRPEGEFLHERGAFAVDQGLELLVEGGEVGVVLDVVQRAVVARVALVLPDVHCRQSSQ